MARYWRPDGNRGLQCLVSYQGKPQTFHIERDHGRGAEGYTLKLGRKVIGSSGSLESAQAEADAWLDREYWGAGGGR